MLKTFIYTYQERPGKMAKARIKAKSKNQVKNYLEKNGINASSIKEIKKSIWQRLTEEKKVTSDDIIMFTQLFSGCIEMKMSVKDSLTMLAKQVKSKIMQARLSEITTDVESGSSLSAAFSKHTDIFPLYYPMLLKAGEVSGDLTGTLTYLSAYLERLDTLRKEFASTFTYPAIVSALGVILISIILIFVAPTFKEVFAEGGVPLPTPTIILFFISDLLTTYILHLLGLVLLVLALFYVASRRPDVRKRVEIWILHTPVVGHVMRETLTLRFLRTFEILVNNQVPILQALLVMEQSTEHMYLKELITEMRRDVSRGLPIAGPLLHDNKLFSPMVSYSISMGEQSGNLGETLHNVSAFTDKDLTYAMKRVATKLSPLITLGLGVVILFVVLAIYLPIFDMMLMTGG